MITQNEIHDIYSRLTWGASNALHEHEYTSEELEAVLAESNRLANFADITRAHVESALSTLRANKG